MAELLEIYKKSIFSNIGNKVSKMQGKEIPGDINIAKFKTKSILDIQKDFFTEVVTPFGTILKEQSDFGKILVNPTTSILNLFDRINNDISPLVISSTSNLLKLDSIYNDIKDSKKTDLLYYSDFPSLGNAQTTSVLSLSRPDFHTFETTDVLKFNSKFDDIVDFKTTSVLEFNSTFDDIVELPYSDVLGKNSKFDDLIIKDIGSVLKVYMASNLPSTVPGVVDFFENIYASGFTTNWQGDSLYNIDKIPPYIPMARTPNKPIGTIVEMPQTPNKPIGTIVEMPQTPGKPIGEIVPLTKTPAKDVVDPVPMPDPTDKPILDINPPAVTLPKITPDIIEMPPTPVKEGLDVFDGMITPDKNAGQLGIVNFIPDLYAIGFTKDAQPYITQFLITDIEQDPLFPNRYFTGTIPGLNKELGEVNFIDDEKAFGFTNNSLPLITQFRIEDTTNFRGGIPSPYSKIYDLDEYNRKIKELYDSDFIDGGTNDKAKYQFNFNDNSYGGVLNQYAVFFSRYPPLTNVTYKTVIDWAYNRIIRVPQAQTLYDKGFHTPTVPIGNSQLIIPPYDYANDRLPTWANTYLSTLSEVGSTLVAGYLSQKTIDLLDRFTDVDLSPWKQSPVIFHQLAGEIYWRYSDLGTVVRNAREATINFASNLVGRTLAEYFIPKVESAIGGVIANAVNNTLNAAVLDDEKVLMLYNIFMGTKYTKSKAYFDKLAKTYNSKYGLIGDNAVNLYNDSTSYTKYATFESAIAARLPEQVQEITSGINQVLTINGIQTAQLPITSVVGTSEEDNSISPIKSTLLQTLAGRGSSLIPVGDHSTGLINKYLMKSDSETFGEQVGPEKYYSVNAPLDERIHVYDGPVSHVSIRRNYPTPEELEKNPALQPKTDLNSLNTSLPLGKNLSDYNTSMLTDFSIANNVLSHTTTREGQYSTQLRDRLYEKGKLLEDKGLPSIRSQFSDAKNRLNMVKMPASAENELGIQEFLDNDLVDFFFEDISSLSDTHESIVIPFRAIMTTISDGTVANWSAQDYMGRADKFWIYQGFERNVAINFEVAINSKDEFISSWNKINYLQGMCYPVAYPGEITLKAPIMSLTIGNLFNRIQVIMNSINYSFDTTTLWEIEKGYQLPMYIKVAVDFKVIFADIPKASARHIAQNQGWADPALFDYNEANEQSQENRRLLITNSGSLTTINKNDITNASTQNNPITFT